jgi:DNA-directed RNA polymerase subunit RPC12/RpoP
MLTTQTLDRSLLLDDVDLRTAATRGAIGGEVMRMALVVCEECKAPVSDKAAACPKCGCPVERVEVEAEHVAVPVQPVAFSGNALSGAEAQKRFCTACQRPVYPDTVTPGSFAVFVVLCFFFIVPGVLYAVWALTSRYDACPKCSGKTLVPLDSPAAQKALGR